MQGIVMKYPIFGVAGKGEVTECVDINLNERNSIDIILSHFHNMNKITTNPGEAQLIITGGRRDILLTYGSLEGYYRHMVAIMKWKNGNWIAHNIPIMRANSFITRILFGKENENDRKND